MSTLLIVEILLAAVLTVVFMGATSQATMAVMAPVAIGLAFACCYIAVLPLANGGLNPARSTATAIFTGADNLAQLWLYWLAPIAGAAVGGVARPLRTQ